MAKTNPAKGMHGGNEKKTRGRTSITNANPVSPTSPNVPITRKTEASRPVKAGAGKHRGDRRDMSKTYTGSAKHSARGSNPRVDVKTRKR